MTKRVALLLAVLLVGCATTPKSRTEDFVPIPQPEAGSPASTDARLEQLQTSLTELLERIDVLNDRMSKLEAAGSERTFVPAPQPASPAAPATVIEQPHVMPMKDVAPVPASPQADVTPPSAPAQTNRALRGAQLADEYRNALMLYGKGRTTEARAAFQRIFDADPSGELADNALYWIGETYFVTGDYATAMRFYTRVTKEFADQNKAPDAMFKMGLSFEKTGDLGMARQTFDEIIKRYPYSTPAASARLELKRIKY